MNQWDDFDDDCDILQISSFELGANVIFVCLLALLASQLSISPFSSLSHISFLFSFVLCGRLWRQKYENDQQILQQLGQERVFLGQHFRFFFVVCRRLGAVLFTRRTRSKKIWGWSKLERGKLVENLHQHFHLYISIGKHNKTEHRGMSSRFRVGIIEKRVKTP